MKDNFSRVLAENLSSLLCAKAIAVFPWRGSTPIDYQVEVEVLRLDGVLGDRATLVARWGIFRGERREMLLSRKSSFSEPVKSQDYEAFVSAQSRTIAALSREIAAEIKAILPSD